MAHIPSPNVNFIEHFETFDPRKLSFIVNNPDCPAVRDVLGGYINRMNNNELCETDDDIKDYAKTLKLAKKYLEYSRHGRALVTYKQFNKEGRQFACGALGLQSFARPLRHTIAGEYYDDIDIKNAHPVILLKMCEDNEISCDALKQYVENREKCLSDLGGERDDAKQVYLSVMNGGNKAYNNLGEAVSEHLKAFKKEAKKIQTKFSEKHKAAFEKYCETREHNVLGGFLNVLMCIEENKVLMRMWEYFDKPEDCVLCFDGIMLRKGTHDIAGCEAYVFKKLGYRIQLEIKPMTNIIEVPAEAPEHIYTSLKWFRDYRKIVTHDNEVVSELVVIEWVDNVFAFIENLGKGCYVAIDERIDPINKLVSSKYQFLDDLEIKKSLNVLCNIANPRFDTVFFNKHKNVGRDNPVRKDPRFNRTKWSNLRDFIINYRFENKMKSYDLVDFIPYSKKANGGNAPVFEGVYNLFRGLSLEDAEPCPDIDFTASRIYQIIKDDLCNGSEVEYKHLFDTIADKVQHPERLQKVSHLFYSLQGTGKSLLGTFMGKILGDDHVCTIIRHDRYLYNSFNQLTSCKLLKIFEELPEKGSMQGGGYNIIKGETTQDKETVEQKGKEPFTVRNFASIWSCTNHENALFIENSDRRNVLHKCSNKHADDKVYFAPAFVELDNPRFIKAAFDWFLNREYDPINVATAIDTPYKQEQKIVSMPKVLKALREYIEDTFNADDYESNKPDDRRYRITVKQLAELATCALSTVETQMKALKIIDKPDLVAKRGVYRDSGTKQAKYYNVHPKEIEERFRSYLKDKTFKFEFPEPEEFEGFPKNIDFELNGL